jgi:branched-chain amino acid transport system substrate-binding protein
MKLFKIATALFVIMILAGCSGNISGEIAKEQDIKIGFIAPLTGGPSLWGQGALEMTMLAVEEINAEGGVNGKRLVIIPEDGKCQPQPAATAAQKLIHADKARFILGGHCSPETATIAPILEENQVFGIAGVSTATGIVSDYSYAFRTSPPNMAQARLIAKVALEKYGLERIAVLTAQTAFTKSISNDFITAFEALGGEIVTVEEYTWPETTDFRTNLIKIKNQNPDAIFVSSMGDEGVQIVRQIKELGIDIPLTGNTVFVHKKTLGLPETAFTVSPYTDSTTEKASELISKYKARFGKDVPYNLFFVGSAYDATYMLKDALEQCGEDTTCVRDYFFAIKDWEGAAATYSFNEKGDSVLSNWREFRIEDRQEVFEAVN